MRMKHPVKTILYGLIFVLLLTIFIGNFLESPAQVKTSLIGSYNSDSPTISNSVQIQLRLHASGNQAGGIKNEPTQFFLTLFNQGTQPVPVYSSSLQLLIPEISLIAPNTQSPNLIHLYQSFPAEGGDYSNLNPSDTTPATLNYFGVNTAGTTIAPQKELFLFSFMGTFPQAGLYEFNFLDGKIFLSPPLASVVPEIDLQSQSIAFNFIVRENDSDLIFHSDPATPNFNEFGRVNQQEIDAIIQDWAP